MIPKESFKITIALLAAQAELGRAKRNDKQCRVGRRAILATIRDRPRIRCLKRDIPSGHAVAILRTATMERHSILQGRQSRPADKQ